MEALLYLELIITEEEQMEINSPDNHRVISAEEVGEAQQI